MSKILIVDDEKSLRTTLKLFLEKENHEVMVASNVDEAIFIITNKKFDLIVSDVIMPGKSGMDLLQYLRNKEIDTPMIIMTGEPTVETAVLGIQFQVSDYISKPICRPDFLNIINRTLRLKELSDEKTRLLLENEKYHKNLEELVVIRTEALINSYINIINLLAKVVEYRDPYTAGHQRRVGNLAADIAKSMKLSVEMVEDVRAIGYIHDIGKINVPAELLSKPSKLSKAEMELIRDHVQGGYEILSDSNLPLEYAKAVYQHHERLDGSGYPNGRKGDEILIESNILIVADVVEAMISHRPYRPAKSIHQALEEITKNRGILYHPEVVDVCVKLFEKCNYKIDDSTHRIIINSNRI